MASFMFEMNRLKAPISRLVTYSMVSMMRSAPGSSGVTACHNLAPLKITFELEGLESLLDAS